MCNFCGNKCLNSLCDYNIDDIISYWRLELRYEQTQRNIFPRFSQTTSFNIQQPSLSAQKEPQNSLGQNCNVGAPC